MYEFKIGDEVEVVADNAVKGHKFVVTRICKHCGPDAEALLYGEDSNGGWFPRSLKLVCPAGYRPVCEDEMDKCPQEGDAFWSVRNSELGVLRTDLSRTYRKDTGETGDTWFRPLTIEPVKTGPAIEEAPVVKGDNNWGWLVVQTGAVHAWDTDMRETEAKAAAMRYSKDYQRTTLVFKVVGEYSTTCTTKWTSADE